MDRVYMNRRQGEERIHVEIHAAEIRDVLDDLSSIESHHPGEATRRLVDILRVANAALPAASRP